MHMSKDTQAKILLEKKHFLQSKYVSCDIYIFIFFFLWGWSNAGTDCPERFSGFDLLKALKLLKISVDTVLGNLLYVNLNG